MGNPFEKFGITDEELKQAISESAEVDAELNRFMTDEVVPYWKSVAPVDEGRYAASVKVTKKAKGGKGEVAATDYKAHWVVFGTGEPGPTKAAAPGEKTAQHFGGSLDGVEVGGEDG